MLFKWRCFKINLTCGVNDGNVITTRGRLQTPNEVRFLNNCGSRGFDGQRVQSPSQVIYEMHLSQVEESSKK